MTRTSASTAANTQPEMDHFIDALWTWFLTKADAVAMGRWGSESHISDHVVACGVNTTATTTLPSFGHWDEWGGSYTGYERASGIVADHVTCRCGQVKDATLVSETTMPLSDIVRGVIAARPAKDQS